MYLTTLLALFLFLTFLKVGEYGSLFKQMITLLNVFDVSSFTDSVERLRHGYLAGRDYVFLYGPLFQLLIGLPSLIFNVPSTLSYQLSYIIAFWIDFVLYVYIARVFEDRRIRLFFIAFILLIFSGFHFDSLVQLRSLIPIAYFIFIYSFIFEKNHHRWLAWIAVVCVPTLSGLITYDLFIYTSIAGLLVSLFDASQNRTFKQTLFYMSSVILVQILWSLVWSGGMNYLIYSLYGLTTYQSISTIGSFKNDFLSPLAFALFFFGAALFLLFKYEKNDKKRLTFFALLAFFSCVLVKSGFIRMDASHIISALWPMYLTTILIMCYLLGKNIKHLIFFAVFPFVIALPIPSALPPIVPQAYETIIQSVRGKWPFSYVYQFDSRFYLSGEERGEISHVIRDNGGKVLIYPDDYLFLSIESTTYNTFMHQFYIDSGGALEKETVRRLIARPPKYVLYTHSSPMDDIAPFTKNPLFFEWLANAYEVEKISKGYVLFRYNQDKPYYKSEASDGACAAYQIKNAAIKDGGNVIDKLAALIIKKPQTEIKTPQNDFKRVIILKDTTHIYLTNISPTVPDAFTDFFRYKHDFSKGLNRAKGNFEISFYNGITDHKTFEKINNAAITCVR